MNKVSYVLYVDIKLNIFILFNNVAYFIIDLSYTTSMVFTVEKPKSHL